MGALTETTDPEPGGTAAMTALTIVRRTAAAALAAFALAACNNGGGAASGPNASVGASGDDMTMGSPNAPVKVIEYASTSCPHCALFAKNDFPALKSKYIDTGKVYYIFREAPIHELLDYPAFMLARCVPKAKYFDAISAEMEGQKEYNTAASEAQMIEAYRAMLLRIGKQLGGLDEQKAMVCMSDDAGLAKMRDRSRQEMQQYGIDQTPTFIVNEEKVAQPGGVEMSNALLFPAIDRALAKKG
jgi:protein-disulfide isomerase